MSTANKRILNNTMFLYIRLLFLMIISFYTYRLLLKELGVEDYGIYTIVGSVVAIFSSLKGLLTSATQRFLNYEMGNKNLERLKEIFSTSVLIHAFIAIIFIILVEAVGLWYIGNKLVIPVERLSAAYIVFHFSVLTTVVSIMTIPFDSVIIANERMNVFAFIAIMDGLLKLGIIGIITLTKQTDKLILYSILLFIVAIIVRSVSSIYSRMKFPESKFKFIINKKLIKEMGKFAGWQFLGNTSFALQNQGLDIVLNFFFGPILNATRGVVMQVNGAMQGFVQNALIAVNPQIVKLYAAKQKKEFINLFLITSRFSFIFFLLISFPVMLLAEELLNIWLVDLPPYTTIFLKLTLIYTLIRVLHNPIDSIIKATGRIKIYQIVDSSLLLITLPITALLYYHGQPPYIMFIVMSVIEVINLVVIINIADKIIDLSIKSYLQQVILPSILAIGIAAVLYGIYNTINMNSLLMKLILVLLLFMVLGISLWFAVINSNDRKQIKTLLINKFSKK